MFKIKQMLTLTAVMVLVICFAVPAQCQEAGAEPEVTIRKIEVTGNFEVPDEEILSVVVSKEGQKLSTGNLQEDLQRIFDLGYFSEDVKAKLSEFEGGAKVTFKVVENPVINAIRIEGGKDYPESKLRGMMGARINSILNSNTLRSDIEKIEKAYHDDGYIAAKVTGFNVDKSGTLVLVVSEGTIQAVEIAYIVRNEATPDTEDYEVTKDGKTKDYIITREMRTKPGNVFNTKALGKDLQRVFNLGFFEDVHTRTEAGDQPGKIVLIIEVEEAKTGSAGFGAGYSSNTGFTGFLTLSERNLKGKGRRGDIKLEFGGKRNNFEFGYFEPWLDKKQTSLELNVYSTSRENLRYGLGGLESNDYEEVRNGFNFTLGRPISDYTRIFLGFKTEKVNVNPEKYDYLDGTSRSVSSTLRTDTRDFVFNPTSGRYDSLTLEYNGGFLGGNYDYKKATVELRRFYPVTRNKKQVFGFRMNLALGKGNIPRFDYFDLGGVNTLRGYDEYQFAGTKRLFYNVEYRFLMSGNLSMVLFGDAGNAWTSLKDLTFLPGNKMYRSFGLGLRLKIPQFGMGPVRLDYAIALDPRDTMIHFGFGHMF